MGKGTHCRSLGCSRREIEKGSARCVALCKNEELKIVENFVFDCGTALRIKRLKCIAFGSRTLMSFDMSWSALPSALPILPEMLHCLQGSSTFEFSQLSFADTVLGAGSQNTPAVKIFACQAWTHMFRVPSARSIGLLVN